MCDVQKELENESACLVMEAVRIEGKNTQNSSNYRNSELLQFLSVERRKLKDDEKQIRIVMAEHEELLRQEKIENQINTLPSMPYHQPSSETVHQRPAVSLQEKLK